MTYIQLLIILYGIVFLALTVNYDNMPKKEFAPADGTMVVCEWRYQ